MTGGEGAVVGCLISNQQWKMAGRVVHGAGRILIPDQAHTCMYNTLYSIHCFDLQILGRGEEIPGLPPAK